MVRRVAFGAALLLALLLPACATVGPIAPQTVNDPYALGAHGTTIDLTNATGARFVSTTNAVSSFGDLPAGFLPPVAVTSYTVTLSIVAATVTASSTPPLTLYLTSPGGSVTLSDGSISGVAIDFSSSATWTLQQVAATPPDYTYTVSGAASVATTVTDPSTLAALVSITSLGVANEAAVSFGVTATGLSGTDTLTLQFGPGSAVYTF